MTKHTGSQQPGNGAENHAPQAPDPMQRYQGYVSVVPQDGRGPTKVAIQASRSPYGKKVHLPVGSTRGGITLAPGANVDFLIGQREVDGQSEDCAIDVRLRYDARRA